MTNAADEAIYAYPTHQNHSQRADHKAIPSVAKLHQDQANENSDEQDRNIFQSNHRAADHSTTRKFWLYQEVSLGRRHRKHYDHWGEETTKVAIMLAGLRFSWIK